METLDAIGHTDSARMKALGAATAGLQVRQGINTVAQAQRQGDASGGMAINFSIGSSSSRSTSEASSDSAQRRGRHVEFNRMQLCCTTLMST